MDPKDITPQNFEAGLHQLIAQFAGLHPFIICGILEGMKHNILSTMREQMTAMQQGAKAPQSKDQASNGEQVSPGNKEFLDTLHEHIAEDQAHKEASEIASNIIHLPPSGITPVQQEPPTPPSNL